MRKGWTLGLISCCGQVAASVSADPAQTADDIEHLELECSRLPPSTSRLDHLAKHFIAIQCDVVGLFDGLLCHLLAVNVELDFLWRDGDVELVEAAVENLPHLLLVKRGSLDLSSGVLVVERDCFAGRVDGDPDFRVVVFVGNLPDIKRFRGCVGQEAEEQDDGVRRGKTIRMDLLGGLVQEGIFVQPVGDVAVKGARLHGHTVHGSECPVCDIEGLEHPEARRGESIDVDQRASGSGCFTNEGDQVVLDFGKSVVVVYHKHVSLAGLAADVSQLGHIHVGHSDHKHAVARMLQLLCTLLDLILGASVCDDHQHLRDVPPHAAV